VLDNHFLGSFINSSTQRTSVSCHEVISEASLMTDVVARSCDHSALRRVVFNTYRTSGSFLISKICNRPWVENLSWNWVISSPWVLSILRLLLNDELCISGRSPSQSPYVSCTTKTWVPLLNRLVERIVSTLNSCPYSNVS
jgi:hypothetical protein